ncbi:helix-turn-helix transcriptional regulator [Streptomyces sp. NPDC086182]|uniref:helix-turn-helix domain-containing protein n=1 Tax=Streptomyces sp. NPDC086182 TaxID=3155058 RepID=UPI003412B273
MTDGYESRLGATLRRIAAANGFQIEDLSDILDIKDLAHCSGVPQEDVRALLEGRNVEDTDLPTRIRQRLHFVRDTHPRPDGKPYTLSELADIAGTSRQWLSEWWNGRGMPNMEHAENLRRHFDLPAGYLTATPQEALNASLQRVLQDAEVTVDPKARMRDAGIIQLAERAAGLSAHQREKLLDFAEFLARGNDF